MLEIDTPIENAGHLDIYPPSAGTPHNAALPGDIADTVLMPGDPLRAKLCAETYLQNAREVSGIRNMLAFTGTYRGKEVSIMGSGMGGQSMGIYSFELFTHYGVERIIRIGTCGALRAELEPGALLFALAASTNSAYAAQYRLDGAFSASADFGLLEKGIGAARALGHPHIVGSVLSSEYFAAYNAAGNEGWKQWARMGCLGTEMETFALYCNAAYLGKKALSILTCVGSLATGNDASVEALHAGMAAMFKVALDCCA